MRYRHRLDRRTVLRGAGSIAVALPFLEAMHTRSVWGAGETPPMRVVTFFFGLGVRPEHLTLDDGGMNAEVVVVEPTGPEGQVNARLSNGGEMVAVFRERHMFKPGEKIGLKPQPGLVHLFDAATGKRL